MQISNFYAPCRKLPGGISSLWQPVAARGRKILYPGFVLVCSLALMAYHKTRGGYKPVQIREAAAGKQRDGKPV
jgi:hypothetical protein